MNRFFSFILLASFTSLASGEEASKNMPPSDLSTNSHLWLEEVEGERALSWVQEQNERSLAELESDPDYSAYEEAALEILTSKERIPYGRLRGEWVYNFWQDDTHVRGLWRRTSLAEYRKEDPRWETVLDFDLLAKEEDKNWVFKGADVFHDKEADEYRCLISLSDGGKDAVVMREFDLETLKFVEEGFITPEAKQGSAWAGSDTLLIGTD
ncbi:MAG: S9 family peptidase, partial [Verrucomicrobiota bacterium]